MSNRIVTWEWLNNFNQYKTGTNPLSKQIPTYQRIKDNYSIEPISKVANQLINQSEIRWK